MHCPGNDSSRAPPPKQPPPDRKPSTSHKATFFPPYVREVVFYLPNPPSRQAAQAALWLASFLGRAYAGRVPRLRLATYPTQPPEAAPFTRDLIWQEGAGASVEGSVLRLGSLAEAARLFLASPGIQKAPFPGETTETVRIGAPKAGSRISLAQLGYGFEQVEGYGTLSTTYTFSLADLGPQRYPIGFRLRAVHSPLPPGLGSLDSKLAPPAYSA